MKNFTFLLLMLCTPSFFGLQAMSPDTGPYYGRLKPQVKLIRDAKIFQEDTESLKNLDNQKRKATQIKRIELDILEEFKKLNASIQESNTENRNNKPTEDNQFTDDENEEIARFAAAYRAHKEEKSLNKPSKNVHFCLPDNPNTEKTPSRENRTNHQFAALCIGTKQQRHTESPIAQFVAAGKERPFSETTTPPSLSPTPVEEEDTLLPGDQKIRTVTSRPQTITQTNKTRKANSFENEYNMLLAQQDDKVLSETSETDEGDFFFR